jgi:hypothetical protein
LLDELIMTDGCRRVHGPAATISDKIWIDDRLPPGPKAEGPALGAGSSGGSSSMKSECSESPSSSKLDDDSLPPERASSSLEPSTTMLGESAALALERRRSSCA